MTYPTDKQIEAALSAHIRSLRATPSGTAIILAGNPADADDEPGGIHFEAMRAALIAARDAEPPPSVEAIRREVARMDAHYPTNDETGNPSEWLNGMHYAFNMVLGTIDELVKAAAR
jgi:hypothetical protein